MAEPDRQSRRVYMGLGLIAAMVGLAVLVFVLEDIREAFTRTYRLTAHFPEAPDLVVDAPVWLAGKPVGRVTHVGLLPAAIDTIPLVAVEIRLPRRVQPQIRRDSYARLTSARLMGERVVDIAPGSAAAEPLRHGDTIGVRLPEAFGRLMARSDEVSAELAALESAIAAIREPLSRRTAVLEPARRELALARREADLLMHAFRTGPLARTLQDEELRRRFERLSTHAAQLGPALDRATGNAEGAGRELRTSIDSLLARIAVLDAEMTTLAGHIDDGDGFIGRAAVDTAIQVAARAAQAELDSLIADVRRNPFRFFRLRLW